MYNLYLDDPKSIKCVAEIAGADASNAKARLLIETKNRCLYFNGKINSNGEVEIPMNSLKGVLNEDIKGKMLIELIVDDMLFTPWESAFTTKMKRKVALSVNESVLEKAKPMALPKPQVKLTVDGYTDKEHAINIIKHLKENQITPNNINKNKNKLKNIINIYVNKHTLNESSIVNVQNYVLDYLVKNIG
jgi:hypothetical protein